MKSIDRIAILKKLGDAELSEVFPYVLCFLCQRTVAAVGRNKVTRASEYFSKKK